jgi:hypothetical protein
MMSVVDDFGRFDGRPSILRPSCYPLQLDKVRDADVQRGLDECEKAGIVRIYWVNEASGKRGVAARDKAGSDRFVIPDNAKPYIQMMKWDKPRAKSSKWPDPPESVMTHAYICSHMLPESDTDTEADTKPKQGSKRSCTVVALGVGGVKGGKVKGNDFSISEQNQQAVDAAVEFSDDEKSRAFFQKAVKAIGPGLVWEAIGEVKYKDERGCVSSRAKYLTTTLTEWMKTRVPNV